jgi:hypothetical protein
LESFAVEGIAMNDISANPVFVALLFILRCIVPLAILFGISYLLRKMGLVATESPEPPDDSDGAATEDVDVAQERIIEEGIEPPGVIPHETTSVENNKES